MMPESTPAGYDPLARRSRSNNEPKRGGASRFRGLPRGSCDFR
jgi:hypothetical protein